MTAYVGLCLSKIIGNLVSQITASCSIPPVEMGVSDTVMVYSKEILIRFFIITEQR